MVLLNPLSVDKWNQEKWEMTQEKGEEADQWGDLILERDLGEEREGFLIKKWNGGTGLLINIAVA
jgi:hypothetical protein